MSDAELLPPVLRVVAIAACAAAAVVCPVLELPIVIARLDWRSTGARCCAARHAFLAAAAAAALSPQVTRAVADCNAPRPSAAAVAATAVIVSAAAVAGWCLSQLAQSAPPKTGFVVLVGVAAAVPVAVAIVDAPVAAACRSSSALAQTAVAVLSAASAVADTIYVTWLMSGARRDDETPSAAVPQHHLAARTVAATAITLLSVVDGNSLWCAAGALALAACSVAWWRSSCTCSND
jgi:hypothetical protein